MATPERPEPVVLAPHVTTTPGVQGGLPCVAGTRVTTDAPASFILGGQSWDDAAAAYPQLEYPQLLAAACFEAGRRYEREQMRRDKRRRWVGTINDADAHRAQGRREGLAEACAYLRDTGRGDWATALTDTLEYRAKEQQG